MLLCSDLPIDGGEVGFAVERRERRGSGVPGSTPLTGH